MLSCRSNPAVALSRFPDRLRLVAVASAVVAVSLVSGCNQVSSTANRAVSDDIASALPRINGTDSDRNKAESSLRDAVKEKDASPEQQIYAKDLLAQLELRSAAALQPQIVSNQADLLARTWEIAQLSDAVRESARLSTAMGKLDPAAVLVAVKKNTADAQGSAEQPDWVKTDSGSVPSLSAVNANIAKLNDQIKDLQTKLQQLNDQHGQLETQADQLDQQSQQAKGNTAVAQFTQASNLRRQADDITVQIDETNVALSRAQADLGVQTGQQAAVTGAIRDFGDAGNQIDQNWQAVQKLADASTAQAKALVGDAGGATDADPTGGSTIAAKAARVQQLAETDAKLRGQAEDAISSAVKFFEDAIGQAEQLQLSLQTKARAPETQDKPEVAAWNGTIAAIDPGRLRLQLASAQLQRANLFADQVAQLAVRAAAVESVKSAGDAAKLTLPDTLALDPKLAEDLAAARQSAAGAYKESTDTLSKISEGSAPEPDKEAAHLVAMYAYYQWSLLDTAADDKQSAGDHFKTAESERDAISTPPTGLPPALAIAPAKPVGTPGMTPPGMTPPGMVPPQ